MLTQSEDIIKDFINKILEEKGVLSMDKEVVDQMRSDLTDRLETRINASVLENIPKDKLEEFEALLDKDNDSDIQVFISKNVPTPLFHLPNRCQRGCQPSDWHTEWRATHIIQASPIEKCYGGRITAVFPAYPHP